MDGLCTIKNYPQYLLKIPCRPSHSEKCWSSPILPIKELMTIGASLLIAPWRADGNWNQFQGLLPVTLTPEWVLLPSGSWDTLSLPSLSKPSAFPAHYTRASFLYLESCYPPYLPCGTLLPCQQWPGHRSYWREEVNFDGEMAIT